MAHDPMQSLFCGEVPPDPRWHMPPHAHSHHELIVIKSGAMHLETKQRTLLVEAGDILFYRAGLIHEEISAQDHPVNSYHLSFSAGTILPDLPLRLQDGEGRVVELMGWMHRDLQEHRSESDCLALLNMIIRELDWLLSRPKNPWLEHIREYLRTHFAERLSLDDVAREAGMSRFAFVRKFKRLSGCTPMEELRRIRLHEARNLILSRDLPLKSIASRVGIGDEYQLSKLFRRQFGVPPSSIRERSVHNSDELNG